MLRFTLPVLTALLAISSPALSNDAHTMPDGTEMDMAMDDVGMGHEMIGLYGGYAMNRDASGTAWQPDETVHDGLHTMRGPWMLMGHATFHLVYDWQDGPRGGEKAFLAGMIMGSARRDLANGDVFQLRAMISPDAFMGKSGYPLLLQAGESADGIDHLVDRQHPHDLFMELSGTYSHKFSDQDSAFVYIGWPGEPAFGPPVFMHRASGAISPEAPISHHWLDSSHVTFGVVTTGFVHNNWKIEASRFKGREPDEDRFDLEAPKFDSTAMRVSWNPDAHWALQASWADVNSPEALEPDVDVTKWSASAMYSRGMWSVTAAWGRKDRSDDVTQDAFLLEAAVRPNDDWTVFSRAERIESDELEHGEMHTVGKLSVGALREWNVHEHVKLGLGGLYSFTFIPDVLDADYGDNPHGAMAFVQMTVK